MRKKTISLILVLVMMATLFSGCRRPDEDGEITTDATEETVPTPVSEYLQNEILPQYNTQMDEMTATYYCQTYGGRSGDFYATTTSDNLYELDQVEPWLLAYNIADYNSDGIEDLFVITLDESGDGEIGQVNVNRRIYLFDSEGNAGCKCWHTTSASASERKMVFAFVDDKLIEMSFYDYSTHSEGDEASTIEYAVTNDIRWHTTSVSVRTYNPETEELDFAVSYSRYNHPSGTVTWDSDYQDCSTEQEAIAKFQTLLSEYGITGIVMPVGSTWANRWDDVFYLTADAEWNAFALETSPTVSERCYGIEQIGERYDGKTALNTTSGEITLQHYEYELYPSQSVDNEATASTEATETPKETEAATQKHGWYTLEEAQEMTGLFILYPDGSFDRYYGGYVLTWDTQPMTYGSDSFPEDLIISTSQMERNKSALNDGQLVIFWPYDNRVRDGLYAVEESGYSLFRTDDEGDLEGLILTRGSTTGTGLVQWNQSHTFYWSNSINYTTINGVPKEQYDGFPSTEGRDFGSFPAHQTFTIGVVEGTTLVEKEYETDHMYFLHADSSSPYTLIPTTDGYAIFDFSDTPSGEYVYTVSRWDPDRRARRVVSTYIVIE